MDELLRITIIYLKDEVLVYHGENLALHDAEYSVEHLPENKPIQITKIQSNKNLSRYIGNNGAPKKLRDALLFWSEFILVE